MKRDDCYRLGEVIKTHGLKGEVTLRMEVDEPEKYDQLESVFLLQNEKLIPFFIESIQTRTQRALVKFEEVDTLAEASSLVKSEAYLPLSVLPPPPAGGYYFHDLVGCRVVENGTTIGYVKGVMDVPGNELLSVDHQGKEVLIPIQKEIVRTVAIEEQRIEVLLPEGLLTL